MRGGGGQAQRGSLCYRLWLCGLGDVLQVRPLGVQRQLGQLYYVAKRVACALLKLQGRRNAFDLCFVVRIHADLFCSS